MVNCLCVYLQKTSPTIEGLKIIQVNTDGVTVAVPIGRETEYYNICDEWQKQSRSAIRIC